MKKKNPGGRGWWSGSGKAEYDLGIWRAGFFRFKRILGRGQGPPVSLIVILHTLVYHVTPRRHATQRNPTHNSLLLLLASNLSQFIITSFPFI